MAEQHSIDIFVLTGELSGDILGADLLKEISKTHSIEGVVGPGLKRLGCKEFLPMDTFNFMGFSKPISSLAKIFSSFKKVKKQILKKNPKIALLIDLPDINLRMAKALKKAGYKGKIIQVVCPTIWAWRPKRKLTLEKYYDHLMCLYPFEKDLFKDSPLKVSYIGHPLNRIIPNRDEVKNILAVFPGSRKQEVEILLPKFLKACDEIKDLEIHISIAKDSLKKTINTLTAGRKVTLRAPEEKDQLIKDAKFALSKNGTINLELGLSHVPQITCYGVTFLESMVFVKLFALYLPHYSLPNIILNKRVVPELMGPFVREKNIKKELHDLLYDPYVKTSMQSDYLELSKRVQKDSCENGRLLLQTQLCD